MSGAPCWLISWQGPPGGGGRGVVGGGDVLHLVDEQRDADAQVAGERGDVGEQLDEVELEVAGVGPPPGGLDVNRRLPARPTGHGLAVLELGAQREGLEHSGDLVDPVRVAMAVADLAHRGVHGLGEGEAQRLLGTRLDLAGAPGPCDRAAAQRVQQHRLADAAQPGEHHAPVGPAGGDALEGDLELLQLAVASGELWRALPGARGVRVAYWVHDRTISRRLAYSVDCASESQRRMPRRDRRAALRSASAPR